MNIANAYWFVKLHPLNFKATGLKWQFKGEKRLTYLIDELLPFGTAMSPEIFNHIIHAVRETIGREGYKTIVLS